MPGLQKYKMQLAFCEVAVENLALHSVMKIPISTRHCIALTGITIKRNTCERIANL